MANAHYAPEWHARMEALRLREDMLHDKAAELGSWADVPYSIRHRLAQLELEWDDTRPVAASGVIVV